jgi:DNA-binding YbaB/EbfC family protein
VDLDLINKIKKTQTEIQKLLGDIEHSEFQGKSSGVEVTLLGNRKMIELQIASDLLTDKELLQESIIIAQNQAVSKIDESLKKVQLNFKMPI